MGSKKEIALSDKEIETHRGDQCWSRSCFTFTAEGGTSTQEFSEEDAGQGTRGERRFFSFVWKGPRENTLQSMVCAQAWGWDRRTGSCKVILEPEAKGKVCPETHISKCPPIFWPREKKWMKAADQSENIIIYKAPCCSIHFLVTAIS